MKKIVFITMAVVLACGIARAQDCAPRFIEVSGTASLNIIPDRITVEIGMEEYFKPTASGDSTLVRIAQIESDVRRTLADVEVPDSCITVAEIGNYRDYHRSQRFTMAKTLTAVFSDFDRLNAVCAALDSKGITGFRLAGMDNADMEQYNRQGLKAALDAARLKAEFIAQNEGLNLTAPLEIIETTQERYGAQMFSNVAFDSGTGMENMRRITRKYSVKVKYAFTPKSEK